MVLRITPKTVAIFDLDDTLYAEIDYVESGFRAVAKLVAPTEAENAFASLWSLYNSGEPDAFGKYLQTRADDSSINSQDLLAHYRAHSPAIQPFAGATDLLDALQESGVRLGLLTNGRSVSQRNKLAALNIEPRFDRIRISAEVGVDKPDRSAFKHFEDVFPGCDFVYFGDNPATDFSVPNDLGWTTFCLRDQGRNIHPQSFEGLDVARPHFVFDNYHDLVLVVSE